MIIIRFRVFNESGFKQIYDYEFNGHFEESGQLTLSGVEESFDDTWTATTYTVEIIADVNLTG